MQLMGFYIIYLGSETHLLCDSFMQDIFTSLLIMERPVLLFNVHFHKGELYAKPAGF